MSWEIGKQKIDREKDFNEEILKIEGELDETQAKITLIKFLWQNLGFTIYVLSGVELLEIQEIIIKAILRRDNSLIVAARGGSKCIDENSFVLTENGFKKIKDCFIKEKIFANQSFRKILAIVKNEPEIGIKIKTSSNYEIKGKKDHRCQIFDSSTLDFIYKKMNELKLNDIIPIKLNMNYWVNSDIISQYKQVENHFNENDFILKNENDLFYLCGLITGDGCIRSKCKNLCSITTADIDIVDFLINKFDEYFPYKRHRITKKQIGKAYEIRVYNKKFVRFLEFLGFDTNAKANTKLFPEKILLSTSKNVCCYLSGLFDSDGYASFSENKSKNAQRVRIGLTSTSYELIKMVRRILLNMGIYSNLHLSHKGGLFKIMNQMCQTNPAYSLVIGGIKNVRLFHEKIGFKCIRKKNIVEKYIKEYKKIIDYNNDYIPIGNYLKNKYGPYHFRKKGFTIHKNVSINRIKFILRKNLVDKEDTEKLLNLIKSDYFFDKITSISEENTKTIDLQVEEEKCYWSDGFINHNSYIISILSIIYPLFFFNSKMCLVSANFRGARRILEYTEKIITSRKAKLLRQCYNKLTGGGIIRRSPDLYKIDLPDPCNSEVFSVPLTEGIRGIRSSFVCIDEMLLVTKELQEVIIRPFLTSKQNLQEELEIKRAEDELIKLGVITENDRKSFPKNKLAGFSSASYQFEYLYEYFNNTIDNIIKPQEREDKDPPTYFCIRYSYEALPENSIIDTTQIKAAAANGGENTDYFKREYRALFSDSNDGYFNAKIMHQCTIKPGDWPTTQILGDKGAEYILSIDPSYASNKNSDFFCQSVYLLNKEERKITLVHTYGRAGADIKEHFEYFVYILTHFNIVFICIDDSGLEFITGFNESSISRDKNLQVGIIKADLDTDDAKEYNDEIIELKRQYNYTAKKIVFSQKFNSANNSIRRMHEHLKNQMEANKVWFASPCCANEVAFNKYKNIVLPFDFKNNKEQILSVGDFIEQQDTWIRETKAQLALIEVKSTSTGVLQYDLPQHLRRLTSPDRPRRDMVSCLLMACWIAKIYFDMIFKEIKSQQNMFSPVIIR